MAVAEAVHLELAVVSLGAVVGVVLVLIVGALFDCARAAAAVGAAAAGIVASLGLSVVLVTVALRSTRGHGRWRTSCCGR